MITAIDTRRRVVFDIRTAHNRSDDVRALYNEANVLPMDYDDCAILTFRQCNDACARFLRVSGPVTIA
jgi:hypothetical protein